MRFDAKARFLFAAFGLSLLAGTLDASPTARSFPTYPPLLPNRAQTAASDGTQKPCITCHNNADGGLGCVATGGLSPCLNPFGTEFRTRGRSWSSALAMLDSDGDGFTNGQELQDPAGTWMVGQSSPGFASYVTRPGFDDSSPGHHDDDADGYCWFGVDLNADGDCLDTNEKTNDYDCDDTNAAVKPGATELCTDDVDNDCNGLETLLDSACASVVDTDLDGYCPTGRDNNGNRRCTDAGEATTDVDCGPTNALVNPGAYESCVDGIDNDCDNATDTADSQCNGDADADSDGYCPIGQDTNANGNCNDAGESVLPSDCDDRSAAISPGDAEICGDLADNDCDGDLDYDDLDCADLKDIDGDGYCVDGKDGNGDGNCGGNAATGDVQGPTGGYDCNEANATIFSRAEENCFDTVDQDCDGRTAVDGAGISDDDCEIYLDRDGDSYCPGGGQDINGDGDCGENNESVPESDCDDSLATGATVYPGALELCFNGLDDDCNGNTDAQGTSADPRCVAYADFDRDGYCATGRDMNGDFDCADTGEQTSDVDMAPMDGTISPGNHEACFDRKDNDQDGLTDQLDPECVNTKDDDDDGYCPMGRDLNGDGDCSDTGENFGVSDCDDDDATRGPQTPEVFVEGLEPGRCFDYLDNDCDGKIDLGDMDCVYLRDLDGDGICGHGVDDNGDGDCLDTDEQRYGVDCADDDPMRASSRRELCFDGVDNDCDGATDGADGNCQCGRSSDCRNAGVCQLDVCVQNVCQVIADPNCADGGGSSGGGGGCAVSSDEPTADRAAAALAFVSWAAVWLGRRRRRAAAARG